ncbi:MAG TPA: hypothetical protein VEG64_13900 [Candidatus Sulfotelmatobacter sp.]|nr:hypothetical protein [Candidatus Sulfotelmatobacter sp.]
MDLRDWSKSEVEYGRKILGSGLEGARAGEAEFLKGRTLDQFLSESALEALKPAALGACLGVLGSRLGKESSSIGKALLFGLVGGTIGFGAGIAWQTRRLTASAAKGALRNTHRLRDEHWVEKHPIAYA